MCSSDLYIGYRVANRDWLRKSAVIALYVLTSLREQRLTKRALAKRMKVSPQQVTKIVKGSENLTLETISKVEQALDINIIDIESLTKLLKAKSRKKPDA